MTDRYDVAVIGAGPAGTAAALRAAELGASVVVLEAAEPGGTCVNTGCVPTRVLAKTARLILQISLLLAWAMPVVAAMTIWIWLFDRRRGVVNYLLDMIPGVEMNRFDWLASPVTFLLVASIIVVWMSVPFVAFSVYAGLTQVSDEVLEAASLDGASGWQRFWSIIAPMIRPVLSICRWRSPSEGGRGSWCAGHRRRTGGVPGHLSGWRRARSTR